MLKIEVEEMRDFFSQKKTYEEIITILQARYPAVREYSVKSIKRFCEKKRNFPQDFSRPRASNDF